MDRGGRLVGVRRRIFGVGSFALATVLAVFHGRLLWQRLTDGSLLQPVVVARWGVSVLLIAALLRLWSRGLPVLRGRRAGVLWLIVALLHAFTPGGPLPEAELVGEGMLPAALALLAFLAIGLAGARVVQQGGALRLPARRQPSSHRSCTGWYRVLFSRPPPASLHP